MIWEGLDKELIFTGLEAASSDDVMREVGSAFVREGYSKDSYVEALMERERSFPTGLDIDGVGVAIPHTSVEHVNTAATGIAILKNPVTFHEMGGDEEDTVDVSIVFMLAVVEPKAHLEELQRILAILQDKNVLNSLRTADKKNEIVEIIKEKESLL